MSDRVRNYAVIAAILILGVLLISGISTRPASEDRVESIGSRIKCPVCQGESIADSPSEMAVDMMGLVEQRVDEGATDDAIIEEILGAFSGAVLLDPPVSGDTLLLWVAPIVALAIGLAVILWWLRHPLRGDHPGAEEASGQFLPRWVGAVILGGALVAIIVLSVVSIQTRQSSASGVAGEQVTDLGDVSNETLEAVIAANLDNPQITGMRLALGGRYYDLGDYRSAFPHYLAVAESDMATPEEVLTALIRLGWMAYDGNGDADTATSLFDEALKIDPTSQIARYLKGTVAWCGHGDTQTARQLFTDLLSDATLADESRTQIEADLGRLDSNEVCT